MIIRGGIWDIHLFVKTVTLFIAVNDLIYEETVIFYN